MGESKPLDLARLTDAVSVLNTPEKPLKARLQSLLAIEATLRQYAEIEAFQPASSSDSVTTYLREVWESLPQRLCEAMQGASEKHRLVGMQIAGKLIELEAKVGGKKEIAEFRVVKKVMEQWSTDPDLFSCGKRALLTQYTDVSLAFTTHLCTLLSPFSPLLFSLLKSWPPASQVCEQALLPSLQRCKKRPRTPKVDNFDPLLAGCKRETDESGFEYQYGTALADCWTTLLSNPLPKPALLEALELLPTEVLGNVADPLVFSDLLLGLFSGKDKVLAIESLPSLLVLVGREGLECKQFYPKLFALFRKEVGRGECPGEKLRGVVERALGSPLLPASLPASFIKCALSSSLLGSLPLCKWSLSFTLSLLKSHSGLSHMLQPSSSPEQFDPTVLNPFKTKAISSSLWEVAVLKKHWNRKVRFLAELFERQVALIPVISPEETIAEGEPTKKAKFEPVPWESTLA